MPETPKPAGNEKPAQQSQPIAPVVEPAATPVPTATAKAPLAPVAGTVVKLQVADKAVNDGKFYGKLFKMKDDSPVSMEEVVVFAIWDKNIIPTLQKYYQFCKASGCAKEQLLGVENLIYRANQWQQKHPERVKIADV